jgi:hypothetical protein
MNDWKTQTLQLGAVTIILRSPVLTEAERRKRELQVCTALGQSMRESLKRKPQ